MRMFTALGFSFIAVSDRREFPCPWILKWLQTNRTPCILLDTRWTTMVPTLERIFNNMRESEEKWLVTKLGHEL
jgi:hypothetical protein